MFIMLRKYFEIFNVWTNHPLLQNTFSKFYVTQGKPRYLMICEFYKVYMGIRLGLMYAIKVVNGSHNSENNSQVSNNLMIFIAVMISA